MKAQKCQVKECGAVVYLLPVDGGEIAVDPLPLDLVVADGERYRVVSGYRPHWLTCVDVAGRRRRLESTAR
jgi:hypothetical protein